MATAEQIQRRRNVLSFIETNPELHDQAIYVRATTACIAGTTVLLEAADNDKSYLLRLFAEGTPGRATGLGDRYVTRGGDYFTKAADLLGLNVTKATWLFYEFDEVAAVDQLRILAAEEPS